MTNKTFDQERLIEIIRAYKKGGINLSEASQLLCKETRLGTSTAISLLSKMTRQNIIPMPVRGLLND